MDWTSIIVIGVLILIAILGIRYLAKIKRDNGGVVPEIKECESGHTCSGCCGGTSCFNAKGAEKPVVVYFNDEELDRFCRRSGDDYTEAELREWSEVLHTLLPEEREPWRRSITMRRLPVPTEILRELDTLRAKEA